MAEFSEIRNRLSNVENLEKELHLKQLQINRLLSITQAINNNVSGAELYDMYSSFLSWEMGIKKMALFVREEEEWRCATSLGIPANLLSEDITGYLPQYTRLRNLVLRAFTSRRIAGLAPDITALATELAESFAAGESDLLQTFAQPLPVRIIARLLGVPEEMAPDLLRWSNARV